MKIIMVGKVIRVHVEKGVRTANLEKRDRVLTGVLKMNERKEVWEETRSITSQSEQDMCGQLLHQINLKEAGIGLTLLNQLMGLERVTRGQTQEGMNTGMNNDDDSVARMKAAAEALELKEKEKPSFELSGKLAAETNRFRGITLLFNEPPEARKPDVRWRLYVFKGGEVLNEPLYIHRQSCYLFGRERRVADIPTDHPSCSKQHALIQYRQVEKEKPDGTLSRQ